MNKTHLSLLITAALASSSFGAQATESGVVTEIKASAAPVDTAAVHASPTPVDTAAITPTGGGGDMALNFDTETLRQRGIDPSVAGYFSRRARFAPGKKIVSVSLNGNSIGSMPVMFDGGGEPCVDRAFLTAAGLKVPAGLDEAPATETQTADATAEPDAHTCFSYAEAFPGTEFTLYPTEDRIEMVTPPEALLPLSAQSGNYQTGGTAALLNYSLFTSRNEFEGGSSDYKQGMFEGGINFDDWLLRSKQMVSQSEGVVSRDSLYTYAQHTFTGIRKIAQVGQINVSSTLFSGGTINGVQLIPETALDDSAGSGVSISGIAQTPQARVDVRQSGALIFSTLVPAGPFTLTDIPVISANTDLNVSVTESSGAVNNFTVPAASLVGSNLGKPQGLSVAVGKLRDVDAPFSDPWLATFSNGWQATKYLNLTGGVMTANKYQSLAGGFDVSPLRDLTLSAKVLSARDQLNDNKGQQIMLSANYVTPYSLSFSVSGTQNSQGYRDLLDTFNDDGTSTHTKNDYAFSTGWSNDLVGSFSLGYSRSVGFTGSDDSKRVTASWSKTFKYAAVSASWQHEIDSDSGKRNDENNNNSYQNGGDTFYVNLSIPFGTQSVNTYMRDDGNTTSYGVQTAGNITPALGYNVSAEKTDQSGDYTANGGLNANLHYTRLSVNAGTSGKNSRNTSATLDGGIVAHSGGVTFSPYAVQETFGIASLGKPVAGIEISTPQGTVWTDKWGNAVVPSLNAYRNSNVMVNTETLPKNVDISNGMKSVSAGHGSVSQLQFGMLSVRRVMLKLTMPDGKLVQKGAVIFDSSNEYVTTAVEDGVVFINDAENVGDLYALTDDAGHKCRLAFTLSDEPDLNEFYENVAATCKP